MNIISIKYLQGNYMMKIIAIKYLQGSYVKKIISIKYLRGSYIVKIIAIRYLPTLMLQDKKRKYFRMDIQTEVQYHTIIYCVWNMFCCSVKKFVWYIVIAVVNLNMLFRQKKCAIIVAGSTFQTRDSWF